MQELSWFSSSRSSQFIWFLKEKNCIFKWKTYQKKIEKSISSQHFWWFNGLSGPFSMAILCLAATHRWLSLVWPATTVIWYPEHSSHRLLKTNNERNRGMDWCSTEREKKRIETTKEPRTYTLSLATRGRLKNVELWATKRRRESPSPKTRLLTRRDEEMRGTSWTEGELWK